MKNKLLLIGGGGHCKSIIDSLLDNDMYEDIAIVSNDDQYLPLNGIKHIGNDSNLDKLFSDGWNNAFIAVGSVGDTSIRRRLYKQLKEIGYTIPNIIDKTAIISKTAILGEGIFVGKNAVINSSSIIGDNAIINTGSIVEHDCKIGNFVHISPNSTVCGETTIGDDTHIGADSSVKQCISIGNNVTVGLGSVVVNDIGDNCIAYGNPCKVIKKK